MDDGQDGYNRTKRDLWVNRDHRQDRIHGYIGANRRDGGDGVHRRDR